MSRWDNKTVGISAIVGQTLQSIDGATKGSDKITFTTTEGKQYLMVHWGDCCESVEVEDVCGNIQDLIGSPILMAEEVVSEGKNPEGVPDMGYQDSFTWTFYKLATVKGYVTIRWYGESNGYYSESVDFEEVSSGKN